MNTKKIFPIIIIVLCVVVMWGVYGKFMSKHDKMTVTSATVEDIVEGEAVVIRNEYPVRVDAEGFFQNTVPNYSKVSRGHTLGSYYIGDFDKEVANKLSLVNEKLREAELSKTASETFINDTVAIDNTIAEYTEKISALSADGDMKSINKMRREIDNLLQRKKTIADGSGSNAQTTIANLVAQRNELETKLGENKKTLYSSQAGIFIIGADGMEENLSVDGIDNITVPVIDDVLSRKTFEADRSQYPYSIAKVVDNSKWMLAIECDKEKAVKLRLGESIGVRLKSETTENITCRVEKVTDPQNGKCVVFVSGTKEIYYIYSSRKVDVDMILNKYTGLKVPKEALQKNAGADVVNVISGSAVVQKPVEILYQNNEIAIINEDNTKDGGLRLYDEVITK